MLCIIFVHWRPYALFVTWGNEYFKQSFATPTTSSGTLGAKVLVVVNTSAQATSLSALVSGFEATELELWTSVEGSLGQQVTGVLPEQSVPLPPRSISTLRYRGGLGPGQQWARLVASPAFLSLSMGGQHQLQLEGPAYLAGAPYLVLGSLSLKAHAHPPAAQKPTRQMANSPDLPNTIGANL